MLSASVTTWYASRSRGQALLILAALLAALAWLLSAALEPPLAAHIPAEGGKDLQLYRSIAERVHDGESYYDAAGAELRAGGYPTGSVFNWRTPVYAWLIGKLPAPAWAQGLLILVALMTLLLAFGVLEPAAGIWPAAIGVLLLSGPMLWCIDGDAYFVQELWAGLLIALSACAYAHGKWPLGFATGLFALFFRELTLPYCLIAAFFARREGRRREVALWLIGFALYGLFWGGHALQVLQRITPGDRMPESWLQLGGAPFLLATCRMNEYLHYLPSWVSAIYLPLSLLGLVGWRTGIGPRLGLTAGAYLLAYTIVGQPFNDYWGLLYAPLLPFGMVLAPACLRDLFLAVLRPVLVSPTMPAHVPAAQIVQ
jgi:hypothetical protein